MQTSRAAKLLIFFVVTLSVISCKGKESQPSHELEDLKIAIRLGRAAVPEQAEQAFQNSLPTCPESLLIRDACETCREAFRVTSLAFRDLAEAKEIVGGAEQEKGALLVLQAQRELDEARRLSESCRAQETKLSQSF